jgi:hypothetical protein
MVLRWLRGVGTLRALKDIPDCPTLPYAGCDLWKRFFESALRGGVNYPPP